MVNAKNQSMIKIVDPQDFPFFLNGIATGEVPFKLVGDTSFDGVRLDYPDWGTKVDLFIVFDADSYIIADYFWSPRPEFISEYFSAQEILTTPCAFFGERLIDCLTNG